MREDATTCSWCRSASADDTPDWCSSMHNSTNEDPAALGHHLNHHKMATDDGSRATSRQPRQPSEERRGAAYARAVEPDGGIPGHVGPEKQLHSGTGYNLVIDTQGKVYGTREPYNSEAIMQVTAREGGEVQIKGKESKFYLAMDDKGKIYAEEDSNSKNTWFKELYEEAWNYYLWMGNNKEWYLGIKKSGKMKPGSKTKKKQKSVKFVPRSATSSYN